MKEFIRDIAVALLIVVAVTVVIKPTIVNGSSMEPTMTENNYVLVNKQAYTFGEEKRGDIIVFKSDLEDENGKKELLIKRIIGLPGDVITISEGNVILNGTKLEEEYIKDGVTQGQLTNFTVPEGSIFVMGDNREVSLDSRSQEVGCVDEDKIVGKAFVRLYPFNQIGGLD